MAKAKRKSEPPPHRQVQTLVKGLESGSLPGSVILRGDERFFAEQALDALIKTAQAAGVEVCRFDSADPDFLPGELVGDLLGGALFASSRMFVIRGADAFVKKTASAAAKEIPDAILARLGANDGSCIVVQGGGLKATHTLIKKLTEAGAVSVNCRKLWDSPPPWDPDPRKAELVQWLVEHARERKIRLAPDQAAFIVAATGNDLAALDTQLDRLAQGDGDMKNAVVWEGSTSPFTLSEPMLAGDAARSIAGLESLFQAGFQGHDGSRTLDQGALVALMCSALLSKLRELVAGAEVLAQGGELAGAIAAAGVKGAPSTKQAFAARLQLRPPADWLRMFEEAAQIERRSRTGAQVDVVDFAQLALRWRRRRPAKR